MSARLFDRLFLDLRMAKDGGAVGNGRLVAVDDPDRDYTPAEVAALAADTIGRRVVFVLHGFNVNREDGRGSLGEFMKLLAPGIGDALMIAVLWPGDSWLGPLGYPIEGPDADDSGAALAQRIRDWLDPGARLSFVAHSKGCRVAMRCIDDLRAARTPNPVGQVCLMAAAMDDSSLTDRGRFGFADATREADRIAILSSVNDFVLSLAYPLGDLLQGWFYSDTDEPGLALGRRGPVFRSGGDPVAKARLLHEATPEDAGVGHGDYLPETEGPSDEDRRAAAFALAALTNDPAPRYG